MFLRSGITAVLLCSLAFGAGPNDVPKKRAGKILWWASVAALALASGLDSRSSWGRPEMNPVLRGSNGRFGGRSVAIKSGLVGAGSVVQQVLLIRHRELEKPLGVLNLGVAGWFTAAALRNYRERPSR